MPATQAGLGSFNDLSEDDARAVLLTCMDVPRWAEEVAAGRPYASTDDLLAAGRAAAPDLRADELDSALARHPRIGEQAGAGHDAEFSEREQSGVDHRDESLTARLAAGNTEYERRFDRVFLIRAAGRNAEEILEELERRLRNDDDTERAETAAQLREIAILRLEQVV